MYIINGLKQSTVGERLLLGKEALVQGQIDWVWGLFLVSLLFAVVLP